MDFLCKPRGGAKFSDQSNFFGILFSFRRVLVGTVCGLLRTGGNWSFCLQPLIWSFSSKIELNNQRGDSCRNCCCDKCIYGRERLNKGGVLCSKKYGGTKNSNGSLECNALKLTAEFLAEIFRCRITQFNFPSEVDFLQVLLVQLFHLRQWDGDNSKLELGHPQVYGCCHN